MNITLLIRQSFLRRLWGKISFKSRRDNTNGAKITCYRVVSLISIGQFEISQKRSKASASTIAHRRNATSFQCSFSCQSILDGFLKLKTNLSLKVEKMLMKLRAFDILKCLVILDNIVISPYKWRFQYLCIPLAGTNLQVPSRQIEDTVSPCQNH